MISRPNGSASEIAARRFSAGVMTAALVRGVTISKGTLDVLLEGGEGRAVDLDADRHGLEAAFLVVMRGVAENDGYNALALAAGMMWRDVALVRALSRFLRQIRVPYSQDYMWATLVKHASVAAEIVRLFHARFDPRESISADERRARESRVLEAIEHAAEVSGEQPEWDADSDREEQRHDHDLELRLRPPDDPREDVGGLDVGAHQVIGRRRSELREPLAVRLEGVEVVRCDERRQQRDEDERECDADADPDHRARHPARLGDRRERAPCADEPARACDRRGPRGVGLDRQGRLVEDTRVDVRVDEVDDKASEDEDEREEEDDTLQG